MSALTHRLVLLVVFAVSTSVGCDPELTLYDDETGSSRVELCSDTCGHAGDGECDDGGEDSDYSMCELGTDCDDCGVRLGEAPARMETNELCSNTCPHAGDGDCDDGGEDSDFSICELGTDCDDCGSRFIEVPLPTTNPDDGSGGDDECTFDSSCGSREQCRSGRCVRVECTTDSHCGSCERCSSNTCRACGSGPYGCYC